MNYQLIMLPNPIVVSDEEIKEGDFFLGYSLIGGKPYISEASYIKAAKKDRGKIIAGTEGLPKLDLSLISEETGWVDVEAESMKYFDKMMSEGRGFELTHGWKKRFIEIFKAAQSLNEKKYSEEDMMLCWDSAQSWREDKNTWEKFIQSISKPKEYNVELEMEDKIALDGHTVIGKELKITNNSITVTKII